jgi:hypothetical protein
MVAGALNHLNVEFNWGAARFLRPACRRVWLLPVFSGL